MKKRIVCYGDSNTWGYSMELQGRIPEDQRWTGLLAQKLGPDYTVIEEGQNGRTTVWDDPIENRMAGYKYLWPCMESQSPIDLLIIMLGTNDTKPYFGANAQNIADGAGRLVDIAMHSNFGRENKAPEILLIAPIRIEDNPVVDFIFGQQAAEKSRGFSEAYQLVADIYGCHFLDASKYAGPGKIDGVHLDVDGHAKLAQAIYEKVREII